MKKMLLLFNHVLSDEQRADACRSLGVEEFVCLPAELQALWSRIPPEVETLRAYLQPVCRWVDGRGEPGDCLLVQGDFGATFLLVEHARRLQVVPVYATTYREVSEEVQEDGSLKVVHIFKHCRFREYGR